MNINKWLIPVMVVVGLVVAVSGGLLFNKQLEEAELQGIIDDTEAGVAALEPVVQLLWQASLIDEKTVDRELADANALLAEALEDAKKAGEFARQKDLDNARYHYQRSVAKLGLFEQLFTIWIRNHPVPPQP